MQHTLKTRLGLFAASLIFTTTAWANDLRPWGEGSDYAQLEEVSASNQHPVSFSTEQITTLLGHFYKREGKKEPAPYFTQDEITRISALLVRLFAKSKPGEDIDFGTSYNATGFFIVPRTLNAGRLFVENGNLNLLIGMCDAAQDIPYQQAFGKYKELNHGSRAKPGDKLGCELLAGNNAERVNERSDWLRLNINSTLATKAAPTSPIDPGTLTFGAIASPAQVLTPAPSAVPVTSSAATAPPTANKGTTSDTEERLTLLKRLHDKGLITDTEFEQKRATVLKGL